MNYKLYLHKINIKYLHLRVWHVFQLETKLLKLYTNKMYRKYKKSVEICPLNIIIYAINVN